MREIEIFGCEVLRYDADKNIFVADKKSVAVEKCYEIRLNGKPFRKIFCTPNDIEDLATGILAQAGKISSAEDITRLEVDESLIDVEIKSNGKPFRKIFCTPNDIEDLATGILAQAGKISFAEDITRLEVNGSLIGVEIKSVGKPAQIFSEVKFVAKDILACADKLLGELSITHDKTNGVHSGALFDGKEILIFREDIGRHNVFDKIHGAALRQKIFLGDKVLIFSGRCSSEMILKVARMNIPVVLAKSVPTTHAINIAKKLGITLAGRLTAESFCIYTNPQRIVLSWEG